MPIAGTFGAVYIGAQRVLDTYHWALDLDQPIETARIKGQEWRRSVPGPGGGSIAIDAWVTTTALLTQTFISSVPSVARVTYTLYTVEGNGSHTQVSGAAFLSTAALAVPHDGPVQDRLTLVLDGAPEFTPAGAYPPEGA